MTQDSPADSIAAPCPKCGTTMLLAAVAPHPIATQMQRNTYLCPTCNQTKTYMLPVAQVAPAASAEEPPAPAAAEPAA